VSEAHALFDVKMDKLACSAKECDAGNAMTYQEVDDIESGANVDGVAGGPAYGNESGERALDVGHSRKNWFFILTLYSLAKFTKVMDYKTFRSRVCGHDE
jgi:hypothetical protein